MPRGQLGDTVGADAARLQKRQDTREVLGPPDAERDHGEIISLHDPQRHALEISSVRLSQCLARQLAKGLSGISRSILG